MKSARSISVFTLLVSTMVLAQSNPVPLVAQSVLPKSTPSDLSMPGPATRGKVVESYGKLPLSFEANQGQTNEKVKFLSRGSGYTLFLTSNEAVSMRGSKGNGNALPASRKLQRDTTLPVTNAVLRMKLVHANPAAVGRAWPYLS